jgi:hypothetical protein
MEETSEDKEYYERIKRYTLDELLEVKSRIDKECFPFRYQQLTQEIDKRNQNGEERARGPEKGLIRDFLHFLFNPLNGRILIGVIAMPFLVFISVKEYSIFSKGIGSFETTGGMVFNAHEDSTYHPSTFGVGRGYYSDYVFYFELCNRDGRFVYRHHWPKYNLVVQRLLQGGNMSLHFDGSGTELQPVEIIHNGDTLVSFKQMKQYKCNDAQVGLLAGIPMAIAAVALIGWEIRKVKKRSKKKHKS